MASRETLQVLQHLEQELCRVRHRTDRFRCTEWFHPEKGLHGMAGLVLMHARKFLDERLVGVPNKKALKRLLKARNQNQITELLRGEPRSRKDWAQAIADLMPRKLVPELQEDSALDFDNCGTELNELVHRIHEFFFRRDREANRRETIPSFFSFERRAHDVPCSFRELVQEIDWYGRQPNVGWFNTEIAVIPGTETFPPFDGAEERILPALRRAKQAGVAVRVIVTGRSQIPSSLQDFEIRHTKLPGAKQRIHSVPPSRHALFMRTSRAEPLETDQTLYYLHSFTPKYPYTEHLPVVSGATQAEEETFASWLNQLPTVKPRRGSGHNSRSSSSGGNSE